MDPFLLGRDWRKLWADGHCPYCSNVFRGAQGVRVHISTAHPRESQELKTARLESLASQRRTATAPSSSSQSPLSALGSSVLPLPGAAPSTSVSAGVTCPECGRQFENQLGLSAHFAVHTVAANNARLARCVKIPHARPHTSAASDLPTTTKLPDTLRDDCNKWFQVFDAIANNIDQFDFTHFDTKVSEFQTFLFEATSRLPGPLHPAVKHFRSRKKKKNNGNIAIAGYSSSSNPQRTSAKARQRRRQRYEFELAQYHYCYQRRKVARRVLDDGPSGACKIPIDHLENHFRPMFESSNKHRLDHYPSQEAKDDIAVTVAQVTDAIRAISIDTSPGYDRVLAKTVRELGVGTTLHRIIQTMLSTGTVPTGLCEGKMVLIPKDGDLKDVTNWRPVSIYSVLRRIVERVLDKRLRAQIELNANQRGFLIGTPGCHINAKLVNACLTQAKKSRSDCQVVFLDVSKAFDHIGHDHIEQCLISQGVSQNLRTLIMSLLKNSSIRIDVGSVRSGTIHLNRSVPQGGPLSPILFNLAINFIYEETCEPQFANQYGFRLSEHFDALALTGFADDQAVTSTTSEGTRRIVEMTMTLLEFFGLQVNPKKSIAINIEQGEMVPGVLSVDELVIRCVDGDTVIRYLGHSFNSELIFDNSIMEKFTKCANNVVVSPLLKPDQKLNIFNQYALPRLTFPLQAAPLSLIPVDSLQRIDTTIRCSVKAIIGLPLHTSTQMIYSPRKYRGLGMIRCEWEVLLQHFAMARKLSFYPDGLLHEVFDCQQEMELCKRKLGMDGDTTRELRRALRDQAFAAWCQQSYQGVGVKHFQDYPKANGFVYDKNSRIRMGCGHEA